MILLDYPPGGLGNFIAQILTNSVNVNQQDAAFHKGRRPEYFYQEQYDVSHFYRIIENLKNNSHTENVIIFHSFGELDLLINLQIPNVDVYQVCVDEYFPMLFLNKRLKACADVPKNIQDIADERELKVWNSSDKWVKRENGTLEYLRDYRLYNKQFTVCKKIHFDNFYHSKTTFLKEVRNLNPAINADEIYNVFLKTQKSIIDKFSKISRILDFIQNGVPVALDNLDLLDEIVLAGELSIKYPTYEWQLPNNNEWFKNTTEILKVINEK